MQFFLPIDGSDDQFLFGTSATGVDTGSRQTSLIYYQFLVQHVEY
jgi:hypothetical protein